MEATRCKLFCLQAYDGYCWFSKYKSLARHLKWDGFAGVHIPHIHNMSIGVANIVVKEDLVRLVVFRIQQQQLAGPRTLIAKLPVLIVVSKS